MVKEYFNTDGIVFQRKQMSVHHFDPIMNTRPYFFTSNVALKYNC